MMHWLKGTEVKKSLAGDSMFIWVGVRLYLLLAVTVMSEVRGTMREGVRRGQKTGDL